MMSGKKRLTVMLEADLITRLKVAALQSDMQTNELLTKAVELFLSELIS
jgi:hypothetical protein